MVFMGIILRELHSPAHSKSSKRLDDDDVDRSGLIQDVGIPGPGTSGPPWSLRTSVLSEAHLMSAFHFLVMPHVMGPIEENVVLTLVEASSGLQSQSTHWLMVSVAPDSPYSILQHLYF